MITETAMPDSQEMTAQSSSSPVGKLVLVGLFALAVGAFFYFDLKQYLSLEALKANRDRDRKSTRLNSSHGYISYAVFCLKKKKSSILPAACLSALPASTLIS